MNLIGFITMPSTKIHRLVVHECERQLLCPQTACCGYGFVDPLLTLHRAPGSQGFRLTDATIALHASQLPFPPESGPTQETH